MLGIRVNHHGMTYTDNPALYRTATRPEGFFACSDGIPVRLETEQEAPSHFLRLPLLQEADKQLGALLLKTTNLALKVSSALEKMDQKVANSPFAKKYLRLREEEKPKPAILLRKKVVDATVKASLEDQVRLRITEEDIERGIKRAIYISERKRELEQRQDDVFEKQKKAAFVKAIQAETKAVSGNDDSSPLKLV